MCNPNESGPGRIDLAGRAQFARRQPVAGNGRINTQNGTFPPTESVREMPGRRCCTEGPLPNTVRQPSNRAAKRRTAAWMRPPASDRPLDSDRSVRQVADGTAGDVVGGSSVGAAAPRGAARVAGPELRPRRTYRYVGPVAGRIGLNDISPTVACGRYPAKAVVGEVITVSATRVPGGTRRRGRQCRVAPTRSARHPPTDVGQGCRAADPDGQGSILEHEVRGDRGARPAGPVDAAGRGLERPARHLAACGRGQGRGRPIRRGDGQRPGDRGVAAGEDRGAPQAAVRQCYQGRHRCTAGRLPLGARADRAGAVRRAVAGAHGRPDPRTGHRLGSGEDLGRPAARRVRLLVRVLPALQRRGDRRGSDCRSGTAPSRIRSSSWTGRSRWASTSSTCRPSIRSAR